MITRRARASMPRSNASCSRSIVSRRSARRRLRSSGSSKASTTRIVVIQPSGISRQSTTSVAWLKRRSVKPTALYETDPTSPANQRLVASETRRTLIQLLCHRPKPPVKALGVKGLLIASLNRDIEAFCDMERHEEQSAAVDREVEFINSIDCCFPYDDSAQWTALIEQSVDISANAAFMVLFEISWGAGEIIRGRRSFANPEDFALMLRYWRERVSHPLAELLANDVEQFMAGRELDSQAALARLDAITGYQGLYSALSVIGAIYAFNEEVDAYLEAINFRWNQSYLTENPVTNDR